MLTTTASSSHGDRVLRAAAVTCVVVSMIASMEGCYQWRIDESYWLHARPGPAVDSAHASLGLPSEYVLRRLAIPVGNGSVLARGGPAVLKALTLAPVNVVLLDYPGSGVSTGPLTLPAVERAAGVAFDWVAASAELAPAGVVVHGHSMGSFVASAVADTGECS